MQNSSPNIEVIRIEIVIQAAKAIAKHVRMVVVPGRVEEVKVGGEKRYGVTVQSPNESLACLFAGSRKDTHLALIFAPKSEDLHFLRAAQAATLISNMINGKVDKVTVGNDEHWMVKIKVSEIRNSTRGKMFEFLQNLEKSGDETQAMEAELQKYQQPEILRELTKDLNRGFGR